MKFRKILLAVALTGLVSGGAQAVPYVGSFNTGAGFDGLLTPVTGFDIFSNGSAAFFCSTAGGCNGGAVPFGTQLNPVATGPATQLVVGDIVTTIYQGVANVVNPGTPSPNLLYPGSSNPGPGLYQISVAAQFNEVVLDINPALGTSVLAVLDPGSRVSLFYDNNGGVLPGTFITDSADILAGTGYTDGQLILNGTVSQALSQLTQISTDGTNASGSANVGGLLDFAQVGALPNTVGFLPAPGDFLATTTLQFGPGISGFATNGFFDNANGFTRMLVNSALVERADANVDLSAKVPEPGTLFLLGIALAGLGATVRRRVA